MIGRKPFTGFIGALGASQISSYTHPGLQRWGLGANGQASKN